MLKKFEPKKRNPNANDSDVRNNQEKVLYVEDEDVNWEVTEFALRGKYALTRAKSARETFELLRSNEYRLILMDIQLKGSELDGIEITRILKGRASVRIPDYAFSVLGRDPPIVFVTAYTARYDKNELLSIGGSDVITKPVNQINLSLVISRLISRDATTRLEAMKTN